MVDFAGWHMPVQYSSIIEEHNTVRNGVGLFDVSHMGEIIVEGKDALAFLNKLVPQELSVLQTKRAVYCQLTNENGGIIDDLIIYKLCPHRYLLVVNASRTDEDINWLSLNKLGFSVDIINESHNYSLLALQGPKTKDLLTNAGFQDLPVFFSIKRGVLFGINLWISRTGYTGEDGVELLVKNEFVELLWNKLLEIGKSFGIKPIGLGARDTLRLEAALPLYGNDLDEETTPIEAGLSWSVSKRKRDDYNGKTVIMSQIKEGTDKFIYGLKMIDRGIARHGYDVYYNDEKAGIITSGGVSPVRGDNIALAYIKTGIGINIGSVVQVMIREKLYNAEVINRPFIKKNNKS